MPMSLSLFGAMELQDLLFHSVPALICTIPDGQILASTRLLDGFFGYIEGELVGKNISVLIPERYRESHAQLMNEYDKAPMTRSMGGIGKDMTFNNHSVVIGMHAGGKEFPAAVHLYPRIIREARCVIATVVPLKAA